MPCWEWPEEVLRLPGCYVRLESQQEPVVVSWSRSQTPPCILWSGAWLPFCETILFLSLSWVLRNSFCDAETEHKMA